MPELSGTPVIRPSATVDVWQEPSGYWAAYVLVKVPDQREWRDTATAFHDTGEAMAWSRERIDLAMADAS